LTLSTLANEYILDSGTRVFPVLDHGDFLGLITLTDLKRVPRHEWPASSVSVAMTPFAQLETASAADDLASVLRKMAERDINQVPLVEGRSLLGLIHRADVIGYIKAREEVGIRQGTRMKEEAH
jgi:CBS domain-containing protein